MDNLAIGQKVILARALRPAYRDLTGTVRRFIKRRGVYEIRLDTGALYDALPESLDPAPHHDPR